MQNSAALEPAKKRPFIKTQDVFKIVTCLIVAMWSISIKNFLVFRAYLTQQNLEHFQFKYGWYILISFLVIFATKYGYYALAYDLFDKKLLIASYQGQSRKKKMESVLKLSYDTIFYITATCWCFYLFRDEPWFPNWVGGSGRCENIFLNYPGIPSAKKDEIEIFYAIQLGVHLFSVFEMMVIKRKTQLKYYEKLLHHMLAASLIALSAMCNSVLIGVMVLFTHDSSDIFMSFGRTFIQTKFNKNWFLSGLSIFLMLFVWIFMRLVVFPFCLIGNVYYPAANTMLDVVNDQRFILHMKLCVLVGMHVFWTYHLVRSIFLSLKKKDYINFHEHNKKQTQLKQTQVSS